MQSKYSYKNITWTDSLCPTTQEVELLMTEYKLHPKVARDLALPTYKDRVTLYDNYIYLILHFPAIRHSHGDDISQEIDFIIGKNFIITNRYEMIDVLEQFAKEFEVNSILEKRLMKDHAGYVFYYIMKDLYMSLSDELESLGDQIKEVEGNIFNGKEKEMVGDISKISRDLMNFEHTIKTHKNVLETFEGYSKKFFKDDFAENVRKLIDEYEKINTILGDEIDSMKEMRDTNDSLLSSKQNEIMKILTIFTVFALPFSIITGFFQMNTRLTPIVNNPYAWPLIVGVEIIITVSLFLLAKNKKWF